MRRYLWNLLVALDQLANTIIGGHPDETISSNMGKRARKGERLGILACKVLNFIDPGHCERYIEEDEGFIEVTTSGKEKDL